MDEIVVIQNDWQYENDKLFNILFISLEKKYIAPKGQPSVHPLACKGLGKDLMYASFPCISISDYYNNLTHDFIITRQPLIDVAGLLFDIKNHAKYMTEVHTCHKCEVINFTYEV
jgi:hypothetical protein